MNLTMKLCIYIYRFLVYVKSHTKMLTVVERETRLSCKTVVTLCIILCCITPPISAAVQTITVNIDKPLAFRLDWTEEQDISQ
jgi:hypothetical protein